MVPWLSMWHLGMMGGCWCLRLWVSSRQVDKVTKPYLTNTEMVSTLTMSREVLTAWKAGLDSADERKASRRRRRLGMQR